MILAAILVSQFLLSALPVNLCYVAALHLIASLLRLPLQLLLVQLLALGRPLFVLLLLVLHQLLEDVRFLQFVGRDLFLGGQVAEAGVAVLVRASAVVLGGDVRSVAAGGTAVVGVSTSGRGLEGCRRVSTRSVIMH